MANPLTIITDHSNKLKETIIHNNRNWLNSISVKFSLLLIITSLMVIGMRFALLPPEIPFWYSRSLGVDQLASTLWIFLMPISGAIIVYTNLIIVTYFTSEYPIFTQLLFISSLVVNILLFVSVIKIIFLIT